MAEDSFQELGAALVGDLGAEAAGQEPVSDGADGDHDGDRGGDQGGDRGGDVVDVVDLDNEPLHDGVDGSWVNKLINGGLGDHGEDNGANDVGENVRILMDSSWLGTWLVTRGS